MHHSYEALDRAGGVSRRGLLAPLRRRDFRLLWAGTGVSLLGDGVFVVALAWQVYALSDVPTAMGVVGAAMTVPTIAALLLGGIAGDRLDRRRLLLGADVLRLAAVGTLAALSLSGAIALWEVVALVAAYGIGQGLHAPAFDAFVPELLPESELAQANAIDQMVRPVALRLAGPALGGALTGALGSGAAFAFDAASFALSGAAVLALAHRSARADGPARSAVADLRDGFRFLRGRAWLWATFAAAALAYLLFMGPVEVLLPFVVKHRLHGGAGELGAVFAAGGVASVAAAMVMGRRGLPSREMTFICLVWTVATLAVAGYGLSTQLWQLMLAGAAFNALETAGTIVWATLKQRHVPSDMLGRVSSLDWLISIGLLPLSFALTGPASAAFGASATLVGAGLLGAAVTAAALFVPGVRAIERRAALRAEPAPV
jgi:DHA3 family tetracycline resistance protein-like MFS transporter